MLTLLDKYTLQNITSFCFDNIISLSSVCKHLHSSLHNSDIANTIKQAIANKHPFYFLLAQKSLEYKLSTNIKSLYKAYLYINIDRKKKKKTYCHIVSTSQDTITNTILNNLPTNGHLVRLLQKRYKNDFMWMLLHGDLVYYVSKTNERYVSYIWNAHTSELMLNHNFNYNKLTDHKYNSYSHLSCNTYLPQYFIDDILKIFPVNYWQHHKQRNYTKYINDNSYNKGVSFDIYKLNKVGINYSYIPIDFTQYTTQLISSFSNIDCLNSLYHGITSAKKCSSPLHSLYISKIRLPSNYYISELYVIWKIDFTLLGKDYDEYNWEELLEYTPDESTIRTFVYNSVKTNGNIVDNTWDKQIANGDYDANEKSRWYIRKNFKNNTILVNICN